MTTGSSWSSKDQPLKFLATWIGANLLGGFMVGFLENNGLQFMATLMLTGAIVGSWQWVVLSRMGTGFRGWPVVSTLGWIVGTLLVSASQGLYRPIVDGLWHQWGLWEVFWLNLVTLPISVLGMALAQSFILQRSHRSMRLPVGGWLLASLVGGVVLGVVGAALCAAFCQTLPMALVGLVNGLGWAAYGLITGLGMLLWSGQNPEIEEE